MTAQVFSVGHSTLDYEEFLKLIRAFGVTAIADVRSYPFSRRSPHFNSDTLSSELRLDQIAYVPLGDELGGRPRKPELFCEGIADYERMAQEEKFKAGIKRVLAGSSKYRVALMCSEHNPLDCHRCLMVGRALSDTGVSTNHIVSNVQLISQHEIEGRLLKDYGRDNDMFVKGRDRVAIAYRKRARQVAYRDTAPPPHKIDAAE